MDAVGYGTGVKDIYLHIIQPIQYEIGRLWQMNRISMGQERFCTAATQMVMSQLYPPLFASKKTGQRLAVTSSNG